MTVGRYEFWLKFTNTWKETGTNWQLALTDLKLHLFRNVASELCHVLLMLTRGRAQRLVLKASEPEGLEACRFLLRRSEPISTVTTVFETGGSAANDI